MMEYSVLMSVYFKERPEYFKIAIESMLNQTIPPSDFVIVCDGALTDELYAVIDGFCGEYPQLFNVIKLQQNVGLGNALRVGVENCRCEYIARMDTDDISLPHRLEKQLKEFVEHPEVSVVGGQISEFQTDPQIIDDYRIVPLEHRDIRKRMEIRNPMNHVTVLMKRSDVLRAENYSGIGGFEDYYLWTKMVARGMIFRNVDEVCCNVRVAKMYARRGGINYFKSTLKMQKFLLENKIISRFRFLTNISVRFCGVVLCPNFLRKIIFKKVMRKKSV